MTKAKTAAPKSNPTQGAVPPIDRTAETLEPVAKAAAAPAAPAEPEDVPMPAIENAPGSVFVPKGNIGTTDVFEILLMYLLHLTGSPLRVEPGVLRQVPIPADRVEQLSDRAKAHMQQLAPVAAPDAPAPDAPAQTAH